MQPTPEPTASEATAARSRKNNKEIIRRALLLCQAELKLAVRDFVPAFSRRQLQRCDLDSRIEELGIPFYGLNLHGLAYNCLSAPSFLLHEQKCRALANGPNSMVLAPEINLVVPTVRGAIPGQSEGISCTFRRRFRGCSSLP
jgi:hypothetical protein